MHSTVVSHAMRGAAAAALGLVLAAPQAGSGAEARADAATATLRPASDPRFLALFDAGERLFNKTFDETDGVGANLAVDPMVSVRFSRVPRPDLPGFQADPFRSSGPTSQSCTACHNQPFEAGSGGLAENGVRDPQRTGTPSQFLTRNPIHLFGSGALQRLAEEATADLKRIQRDAVARARSTGINVVAQLTTENDVNYGALTASPSGAVDLSQARGLDPDLVVKPYFWKGELASFLRALVRGSGSLELGLYPVELVGANVDIDLDGVANELTIPDVTAMTLYVAAQPRPVTRLELERVLGGKYALSAEERRAIRAGEAVFERIGCTECHRPSMTLRSSVFQEPSASADYRDPGLDPSVAVRFDLAANPTACRKAHSAQGRTAAGASRDCFPQFERSSEGDVIVRLYGDLKRHDMGPALTEAVVDEAGQNPSYWKTRELWGAGSTGPWLHDGRATTLSAAILLHGGESQPSRDRFAALGAGDQADLVSFLKNLVLFKPTD